MTRPRYRPTFLGRVLGACLAVMCVVAATLVATNAGGFVAGRAGQNAQRGLCGAVEGSRVTKSPKTQMRVVVKPPRIRSDGLKGAGHHNDNFRKGKSVLAYAKAGKSASGVTSDSTTIRRMWEMYDMEYNNMAIQRQMYWRTKHFYKAWMRDWKMMRGEKRTKRKIKDGYDAQWTFWMRTKGKALGLQQPVTYDGPPLAHLKPENFTAISKVAFENLPTPEQFKRNGDTKKKGWKKLHPWDIHPGKYIEGEEAIHNVFPQPLKKHLVDIDFHGYGKITRGLVW